VRALSTEPGFPGTAEQVIAQAAQYRRAGVDELALSFAGPQPTADAAYFARAVKRLIPDGELAIDSRPATAALSRTIATARAV
jgi:L-alanine-DL-glutamate epimerase-like enolase superfamily enzyme